jgi:hypothetical protein
MNPIIKKIEELKGLGVDEIDFKCDGQIEIIFRVDTMVKFLMITRQHATFRKMSNMSEIRAQQGEYAFVCYCMDDEFYKFHTINKLLKKEEAYA